MSLNSRQVLTANGSVTGIRLNLKGNKQADVFYNIPFAQPPVGSLRFKKPVPAGSISEDRDFRQFGNRPIQKSYSKHNSFPFRDEDCLNLNIFTPTWKPETGEGFAVIFYIFGGGFMVGSAVDVGDENLCEHLVTKNVLVITCGYRLGYLGMFSTGDSVCPGNNVLWDMTLALQWVKDNIASFDGDPNNVTVMGHSSGGTSADLLSLSPHSRDLVHKVVAMGGNACCERSFTYNNAETCRQFAASLGINHSGDSEQFLEELRQVSADKFGLFLGNYPRGIPFLGINIDGDFLPKHPSELRKEAPIKPRMYGQSKMEFLGYLEENASWEDVFEVAERVFPEDDYPLNYKHLRAEYIKKISTLIEEGYSRRLAICQALSDPFQNIGTQKAVVQLVETGNDVFLYQINHFNKKTLGKATKNYLEESSHCCDICYVLKKNISLSFEYDEEDMKMVDLMTTYWTNFAKYGDPNGTVPTEKWSTATKENPQRHLQISLHPRMSDVFLNGRPMWIVEQERKFKDEKWTLSHL